MQYYIYKITNSVNGKSYIGQHKVPLHGEAFNRYMGKGIAIRAAIKKHGKEKFTKEILEYIEDDEKHLKVSEREIYYIKEHATLYPNGYNISPGGEGGVTSEIAQKGAITRKLHGYRHSVLTRKHMSEASKGVHKTDTHKKHLSEHHHLKTIHTIVFENGADTITTSDSIQRIALEYGCACASLSRRSSRNEFTNGIKILDLYDPISEMHWKMAKHGVFIDPYTQIARNYFDTVRTIAYHKQHDSRYARLDIWKLFDHFDKEV